MSIFDKIHIPPPVGSFCRRGLIKKLYLFSAGLILSCFFVLGAAAPPTEPDILFVKIPAGAEPSSPTLRTRLPQGRYVDGCQITRMSLPDKEGKAVPLTAEFLSARDPAVSFDGREILFAGKREKGKPWQIWRMDASGGNKKQITHGTENCVFPLYVGSLFHLDDKAPTRKILYQGGNHLYTCDLNGKNAQRITHNLYPEFSPDVLPNGRIIFSSLKSSGGGPNAGKNIDLLAVNIDGTDLMAYLTDRDVPGDKEMVRVAPDGRVYFIQGDTGGWLGGGSLASVSQRRPAHSYRLLASAEKGYYHSPCPLPDGGLIVSFRSKEKGSLYSLFLLPPGTFDPNNQKFLRGNFPQSKVENWDRHTASPASGRFFKKAPLSLNPSPRGGAAGGNDYHHVDARVLAPHPVVKGRSSFVEHKLDTGVLYCVSVYISDRPEVRRLAPGAIKQVRVREGVSPNRGQTVSRRILGTALVEADGSFHIRVPAETPLVFELLDKEGRVVCGQHSWSWVMPRESRGCIGCHENRELAPPNQLPQAIIKPAVQLTRKQEPQPKKGNQ